MRVKALLMALAMAAALAPGSVLADPAQSSNTEQTPSPDADQVVCKTSPPPIGSRLGGGRECHTKREWDQRAQESQKDLQDKQMHGLQSCIGSCGG